jgi:hypothetical protein
MFMCLAVAFWPDTSNANLGALSSHFNLKFFFKEAKERKKRVKPAVLLWQAENYWFLLFPLGSWAVMFTSERADAVIAVFLRGKLCNWIRRNISPVSLALLNVKRRVYLFIA